VAGRPRITEVIDAADDGERKIRDVVALPEGEGASLDQLPAL
jgi:hypothetical protein